MQALGFRQQEEAVLTTLTEDVLKSSEIEGEILDKDQVRSSIARRLGIEAGALPPADRNVEGVVEMMLDSTQKFNSELTADRLFGWHASLFRRDAATCARSSSARGATINPGRCRSSPGISAARGFTTKHP